jgi:hypothetical protein
MKYVAFWEFCPGDIDKVIERFQQVMAERKKFPDKYPKVIFGPFSMSGETKGFVGLETDDPEQMMKWALAYWPVERIKFVSLFEVAKIIELYQKMKK